ncbi:MAG: hypothetical protein OES47_04505 [Acidobacteriota bacterium]|nr:hypothetical protein [Acidobacteriota bacterium]
MSQVTAVGDLATHPVATVKGVPGGVKRMFKRVKRDVDEGVDTVKELSTDDSGEGEDGDEAGAEKKGLAKESAEAGTKYGKKYFGATRAERLWAEKLGIDPYTSNEALLGEIKKVAKVDAAGGFTVKLAPIPRIPGVGAVEDLNNLVWRMDPRELREQNIKTLTAAGVSPEMVEELFASPWYSPTLQTYLIGALTELKTVAGFEIAVQQATEVESSEEALFFVDAVRMLETFQGSSAVVARLLGGTGLPAALTTDRRLIFQVPSDFISWTEEIAAAADGPFGEVGADLEIDSRELWFRGGVSERCRLELEQRGWVVKENVAATTTEDGAD